MLAELERKILWLASWTIHNANHLRDNGDGLKVGGHQASSASLATIMTALYFAVLRPQDRVAVKPHASPNFHAIQYLLGHQTLDKLQNFRGYKGAQSYPSRTKDVGRRGLLDRLCRPRRRANVVLVARAGLRPRARLGEGQTRRPHGRPHRRRRDGRRQHLRGPARRLEARRPQHLVDRRLQPPKPRRRHPRRPVVALRNHVPQFRLGRGDSEIRLAPRSRFQRTRRRQTRKPGSTPARTNSTPRSPIKAAPPGANACSTTSAIKARRRSSSKNAPTPNSPR